MKTALLICMTLASASFAVAQTPPADSTAPSSASSPHQRESTSTDAKEAATTPSNPTPAAASSPHQHEVTEGGDKTKAKQDKMMHDKMMKDCVSKQQSMNSSMSQDDAKKTCTEQMKVKMRSEQPK